MLGDMVGFTKTEAAEKPEGEWNLYDRTDEDDAQGCWVPQTA